MDVFRIELPDAEGAVASDVAQDLRRLDAVAETSADTRSIGAALVLVKVVGGVLGDAATAVPIVQKVVEMIRGKGVTGAKIELPNGTKISVDSASVDEIERLVAAATRA